MGFRGEKREKGRLTHGDDRDSVFFLVEICRDRQSWKKVSVKERERGLSSASVAREARVQSSEFDAFFPPSLSCSSLLFLPYKQSYQIAATQASTCIAFAPSSRSLSPPSAAASSDAAERRDGRDDAGRRFELSGRPWTTPKENCQHCHRLGVRRLQHDEPRAQPAGTNSRRELTSSPSPLPPLPRSPLHPLPPLPPPYSSPSLSPCSSAAQSWLPPCPRLQDERSAAAPPLDARLRFPRPLEYLFPLFWFR